MQTVSLFDAKTHLSRLVERIASGEEQEIIISRNGKPAARMVPVVPVNAAVRIGLARGEFEIPEDIDRHNEEIARLFAAKI